MMVITTEGKGHHALPHHHIKGKKVKALREKGLS